VPRRRATIERRAPYRHAATAAVGDEKVMRKHGTIALVLMSLAAALFAVAAAAAQTTDAKQITDRIAKEYGVKVLKVVKGEEDGKPVLFVTVMNDGGNYNDAFQVNTLAVDPATGDLIPQYRTTPTGQELSGAVSRRPEDESGLVIRQRSMREPPR
jgi:hypothetical protein